MKRASICGATASTASWRNERGLTATAEGEKETKERIAANLLSLGVPIETIVQASGLSEEEITNIQ